MLSISGTVNQIPVKVKYLNQFTALLKNANIQYKFAGALIGYSIFEFNDKADTSQAIALRDTLYKTNKL